MSESFMAHYIKLSDDKDVISTTVISTTVTKLLLHSTNKNHCLHTPFWTTSNRRFNELFFNERF